MQNVQCCSARLMLLVGWPHRSTDFRGGTRPSGELLAVAERDCGYFGAARSDADAESTITPPLELVCCGSVACLEFCQVSRQFVFRGPAHQVVAQHFVRAFGRLAAGPEID